MELDAARERLRERIYDLERAQQYFEAERLRGILRDDAATLARAEHSAPPQPSGRMYSIERGVV
jgi:hypothetical protein